MELKDIIKAEKEKQILMQLEIDGKKFRLAFVPALAKFSYCKEYRIEMYDAYAKWRPVFETKDKNFAEVTLLEGVRKVLRKDHCFANLQLWYRINFDDCCYPDMQCLTLYDVFHFMQDKKIYSDRYFFADDSVTRERVFQGICERHNVSYDYLYDLWISGTDVTEDCEIGVKYDITIDKQNLTIDVKRAV